MSVVSVVSVVCVVRVSGSRGKEEIQQLTNDVFLLSCDLILIHLIETV